mgnify:CR=1 FL=1
MGNIRNRYFDIAPGIFFPAAFITLVFVVFTITYNQLAEQTFSSFQTAISSHFGWFIAACINYYLVFVIILAFTRLGTIRIGGRDAKPDFNKFSWIAMLFSAGMGIGLVYFSVAEPMLNFAHPVSTSFSPDEKAAEAMKNTFFHYGLHVWGIYILLGIALAYFTFNKNSPLSIRSLLAPLLGNSMYRWPGHLIEVIAVLATLFGLATSLGFGAVQFSTGVSLTTGIDNTQTLQILSIAVITLIATGSVVSGLNKGLKLLSNFNIVIALVLFTVILLAGSTTRLLTDFATSVGRYAGGLAQLSGSLVSSSDSGQWFKGWSLFYWAWWISWSPFVGTFIARISKGRTIREIAIYGLLLPSVFSFLWMAVLGGTALEMQLDGSVDLAGVVSADSSKGLFAMLDHLPFAGLTSLMSILLVATFFITSSDSGSLVVDYMTSGGKLDAPVVQKVFWAFMEGTIAIALLVGGGLAALQSASISTGLPFAVILTLVSISLVKALKKDEQLNAST